MCLGPCVTWRQSIPKIVVLGLLMKVVSIVWTDDRGGPGPGLGLRVTGRHGRG